MDFTVDFIMDCTSNFMLNPPYFIIDFMTNFITCTKISLKSTGFHYGFYCGFHSSEICNENHNEIRKWNQQ